MKYHQYKRKKRLAHENTNQNEVDLDAKINEVVKTPIDTTLLKKKHILYNSGWIQLVNDTLVVEDWTIVPIATGVMQEVEMDTLRNREGTQLDDLDEYTFNSAPSLTHRSI